jgi:hypothetical protein
MGLTIFPYQFSLRVLDSGCARDKGSRGRVAAWHFPTSRIALVSPPRITRALRHFRVFVPTGRDGKDSEALDKVAADATPLTADPDIVFELEGR